jgi:hypothetical protein
MQPHGRLQYRDLEFCQQGMRVHQVTHTEADAMAMRRARPRQHLQPAGMPQSGAQFPAQVKMRQSASARQHTLAPMRQRQLR